MVDGKEGRADWILLPSTKSTSKKATVKNGNASSKSKRKSSASASAPKRASKGKGGKMAISLGISPKLSVKGKKSLDKAKTADSDVDDDLVDSEDDSLPKKVLPKNNKKGLGVSRKSRKGRSTLKNALQEHKESRKRQLEDDSSENNFQKKGRSDSDESSASSDSDESEYWIDGWGFGSLSHFQDVVSKSTMIQGLKVLFWLSDSEYLNQIT